MKKLTFYILSFSLMFSGMSFGINDFKETDETLIVEIKKSATALENALDQRNFKVAKEQLSVLYPLMKKEFKQAKKQIHEFEKERSSADAEKLQNSLERKIQIHDRLHSLSEASSASLRVQADDAKALVREYMNLLEERQQLLSSLN